MCIRDRQVLAPNTMCEVENNHDDTLKIINDTLEVNSSKISGGSRNTRAVTGLNCAGYGSSVCVTATFGFVAAGLVLQKLLG